MSAGILKISAGLCRMALLVAVASPSYAVVEELDGQRAQQATYVTIAATTPANLPVDAADMVDVGSLAVSITRTTPAPVMVKVSVSLSNANNTPGQARNVYLRLTDGTSSSEIMRRFQQGSGTKDVGTAELVHVFNHPGGGAQTYKLQAAVDGYGIGILGTIAAVPLRTKEAAGNTNIALDYATAQTVGSGAPETSTSFVDVPGTTLTAINLPHPGDFYVVASFNILRNVANAESAEYRLQYQKAGGGWNDFGQIVQRSLSGTGDAGIGSLTALLQGQDIANYDFRLMHRSLGGTAIVTEKVNIAALALGFSDDQPTPRTGAFDSWLAGSQASTTASTPQPVQVAQVEVSAPTALFMSSVVNATSTGTVNPDAEFNQRVLGGPSDPLNDGVPIIRFFANAGDVGIIALVDVSQSLQAGPVYSAELTQQSNGSATLTTTGTLTGFALSSDTVITVTYALLEELWPAPRVDGSVDIYWRTAAESAVAGYFLERWDDSHAAWVRVNDKLVSALPVAPLGATYRLEDPHALPGSKHRYRLVEVETGGAERRHDFPPLSIPMARPDKPYARTRESASSPRAARQSVGASMPGAATVERYLAAAEDQGARAGSETVAAPMASARAPDTAGLPSFTIRPRVPIAAALRSLPKLRLSTTEGGLYELAAGEIAAGMGTTEAAVRYLINRRNLTLSSRGKPVSWLPSEDGAAVRFYAEVIDSLYTNENVFWLGVGSSPAMPSTDSGKITELNGAATFFDTRVSEENNWVRTDLTDDPEADLWYWGYAIGGQAPAQFSVAAPAAAAAGAAVIKAFLQGGTEQFDGNDHHVQLDVNGVTVGEARWDGIAPAVLEAEFDQAILLAGENMVTVTALLDEGVEWSGVWVDRFELSYQRYYQALDDQLWFHGVGSQDVAITGFSNAQIWLFDISDPARPVRVERLDISQGDGGAYTALFSPRPGKSYFATARPLRTASLEAVEPFDLMAPEHQAEYLVIAPASLLPGAQALSDLRSARYSTAVVPLQAIYDQFSDGVKDPHAIRDYLAAAWGSWEVQPRFVVLAGKGTLDPKDHAGVGSDLLPILVRPSPSQLFAADSRMADLVGDDGLPEVALGRLPVLTSAELEAYVDKLAEYESAPTGDWQDRALMLADNPSPISRYDDESDLVTGLLPSRFETLPLYHQAGDDVSLLRAELIDGLKLGAVLFNYVGHGSQGQLGDEGFLRQVDVNLLDSGNGEYPLFLALSCLVADSSYPGFDSLAEVLVLKDGGGAIAAVAPTGFSRSDQAHILNMALATNQFGSGEITIGEAMQAALAELAAKGGDRFMLEIYSLVGDPAITIRDR